MDGRDGCTTVWVYLVPLDHTLKNGLHGKYYVMHILPLTKNWKICFCLVYLPSLPNSSSRRYSLMWSASLHGKKYWVTLNGNTSSSFCLTFLKTVLSSKISSSWPCSVGRTFALETLCTLPRSFSEVCSPAFLIWEGWKVNTTFFVLFYLFLCTDTDSVESGFVQHFAILIILFF